MVDKAPTVLVVASDWEERVRIAFTLREAGFTAVAAADGDGAMAALRRERFAAAVIAMAGDTGVALMHTARRVQPRVPALLVLEPAAMRLTDGDGATIIKRPLDPRQLLGCVFELVLREDDAVASPAPPSHAAELCIAAARLACLQNRRAIAAAAGASRVAQELTRQIGEMRVAYRGFAAARSAGALAAEAVGR